MSNGKLKSFLAKFDMEDDAVIEDAYEIEDAFEGA